MRTEPYARRHYAIMGRLLGWTCRADTAAFGVRIEVDEPEPAGEEQAAGPARPVIVLSRHAGPGDSILLVRHLLTVHGRRPQVIMKAAMQLDPSVDVLGHRLPKVFISPGQAGPGQMVAGPGRPGPPGRWPRGPGQVAV